MKASGTVRPVTQSGARLKEAERLGFSRAVVPETPGFDAASNPGFAVECFTRLNIFVEKMFGSEKLISRRLHRMDPARARAGSEM